MSKQNPTQSLIIRWIMDKPKPVILEMGCVSHGKYNLHLTQIVQQSYKIDKYLQKSNPNCPILIQGTTEFSLSGNFITQEIWENNNELIAHTHLLRNGGHFAEIRNIPKSIWHELMGQYIEFSPYHDDNIGIVPDSISDRLEILHKLFSQLEVNYGKS